MDFVRRWSDRTEIPARRFIDWLEIAASKFYEWRNRYGKVNEHNSWIPRDHWLEEWERLAILTFYVSSSLEGVHYQRNKREPFV